MDVPSQKAPNERSQANPLYYLLNPDCICRCLIDSSGTTCKATCKIQGYEEGICSPQKECKCSGKSKWGHTIDTIEDAGQAIKDWGEDFFG